MFVTRVDTGEDIEVRPPPGTVGFDYQGAFSPDGETVAVAVRTGHMPTNFANMESQLAFVDVRSGTTKIIDGTALEGAHVFIDWSPSGEAVFMAGGNQFEKRSVIEYQLGAESGRQLPVEVGDFYGMAAA